MSGTAKRGGTGGAALQYWVFVGNFFQSQEKVTVTRSVTGGRSIRTKENILAHPKHAYFSSLSEGGFLLVRVFLSGERLNLFLDSGCFQGFVFVI